MVFNLILTIALKELILNTIMFLLLGFGSLLWTLSIVAVVWGIYDGFIPAIHRKEYAKASVILLILLITCIIIVISLDKAVYLVAYIVPIFLLYLYVRRFASTSDEIITDYRNN